MQQLGAQQVAGGHHTAPKSISTRSSPALARTSSKSARTASSTSGATGSSRIRPCGASSAPAHLFHHAASGARVITHAQGDRSRTVTGRAGIGTGSPSCRCADRRTDQGSPATSKTADSGASGATCCPAGAATQPRGTSRQSTHIHGRPRGSRQHLGSPDDARRPDWDSPTISHIDHQCIFVPVPRPLRGHENHTAGHDTLCSLTARSACASPFSPSSPAVYSHPPSRPLVLLVSFDTTRADALSCYGALDAATPHADRLAAEGVRFAGPSLPQAPHSRPTRP